MKIVSFSPFGYEGSLVTIEVDLRRGIPAVDIVGLADNAVKESRERMKSAIINSGFDFPKERVLISLAPSDLKKEGAGFDLALALAILEAQKSLSHTEDAVLVMAELELSGHLRPVRGVHAAVSTAKEAGVKFCIVSKENEVEAHGAMDGVFACSNLKDAFEAMCKIEEEISRVENENVLFTCSLLDSHTDFHSDLCSDSHLDARLDSGSDLCSDTRSDLHFDSRSADGAFGRSFSVEFPPVEEGEDFAQVENQDFLIRGLQIAASGRHNVITFGPPGCGKTLALQRYKSLLPYLTDEEARSVTRIYSLAGLIGQDVSLIKKRPFRMPHQSASLEGMCGGGHNCMPGEISLAHNGVLFLDEASEFKSGVLQMLRVPMEQHSLTLSRAGRSTTYPANFQLLLATNPCPCGNFGSSDKICLCSMRSVEQYWKKFSAPLLDRIDIRIDLTNSNSNGSADTITPSKTHAYIKTDGSASHSSEELRKDIAKAIQTQMNRQGKYNSYLTPEEINYFCKLNEECSSFLQESASQMNFSTRAIHSSIKLARTIADMAGSYEIRLCDLKEAMEYRKNEGGLSLCF